MKLCFKIFILSPKFLHIYSFRQYAWEASKQVLGLPASDPYHPKGKKSGNYTDFV
jgi:hypothetical protein